MTPASVDICECWARDGLQSWPDVIATDRKLAVLMAAIAAGVREVDATSLVPARYAPQFADAAGVIGALADSGVRTRVLTPNLKGVERAVELQRATGGVTSIGFPISASAEHNLANVRRTHDEHLAEIGRMIDTARSGGLRTVAAVATAYGCPIIGNVAESAVFEIADQLVALGVDRIMFSDTTGLADPVTVARYTARARQDYPAVELIAHFHDTRGTGIANTYAAVVAGASVVDSCLGGIGGEPKSVEQNHAGETGNVATEDIAVLLERSGIRTGLDLDALIDAGRIADIALGVRGRSQVQRTGTGITTRREQH